MRARLPLSAAVLIACAASACDANRSSTGQGSPGTIAPSATPEPPTAPSPRRAGDSDALQYTLKFDHAHQHLIDVELNVPAGDSSIELVLATWTPGSYLIREYARQIEGLVALDPSGTALAITKTKKNRWRVEAAGKAASIRYRVYAREMSVRTNFVDDEVAMVVGAATFMTVDGRQDGPHDVAVVLRPGWARAITGLDLHPSGAPNRFVAESFDELVDSPFLIGNPIERSFDAGGVPHEIATFGAGSAWDADKSTSDVAKIVAEQQAFWGEVPYRRYVILNALLSKGGMGGLEHLDSTLLLANPFAMAKPARYRAWLGLVSHEVFHTWNGKRLRPEPLGPFDYENEVYTDDLWIVEGLTSYYDDLTMVRAGLYNETQYLEALGGQIESLQKTPGRFVQPLSRASYDAWIKYYRRDENSTNTSISYYTKGSVVGFLLDMLIRRSTGGKRSLDDVMRRAYARYGGDRGYTSAEFRALASEVAGTDLSDFFSRAVDSTDELDYQPALDFVGLQFKQVKKSSTAEDDEKEGGYLGVTASSSGVISRVLRDTPGFTSGLNVDDEILAIEGERLGSGGLKAVLKRHAPGDDVAILIARRGRVRTLRATLAKKPESSFKLEKRPARSASQAARASAWLSPVAR